jgi:hypothetical protein
LVNGIEVKELIPVPEFLKRDKKNPEAWEKLADMEREKTKVIYQSAKAGFRLEDEDPAAWHEFIKRNNFEQEQRKPIHKRGPAYWDVIVESFQEIIQAPNRSIAPHAFVSPSRFSRAVIPVPS